MFGIRTVIIFMCMLAISKAIDPNNICCLLKDGSKIVDDTNCGSYYTCKNAKATKATCQAGYNFNKNAQNCQPSSQFACDNVETNVCAGITTTKFVSNPNSCKAYYYCVDGAISHGSTCQHDLYFNEEAQMCDYKENVMCTSTNDNPKAICAYVEDNQYFGSASNCAGWTKCTNGKPASGTCDIKYIFNVQKNECDYKDGYTCPQLNGDPSDTGDVDIKCKPEEKDTIKANGNSCGSYLKCDGVKFIKYACSPGLYYQPITESCEKRLDAITFEGCNRCEGNTLDFVNIADDQCKGYARCKNGKPQGVPGKCKTGYFFNESFGSCTNTNPKYRICFNKCETCTAPCVTDCTGKETCDCICPQCDSKEEPGVDPPTALVNCEPSECAAASTTPINVCNTPDCDEAATCACICDLTTCK